MHFTIFRFNRLSVFATALVLICGTAANSLAQTTNSIPANVFLTDDGKTFWYKSGQRLIDTRKIKEAQNSPESKPASEDPEGNWGQATNGFQLSLRFEKQSFTNGEPVIATMLMRNVTDKSQIYFRPTHVAATKDGKPLKRKDETGFMQITVSPETKLFPQTQNKYQENLNQIFDLSESGEYIFEAVCRHPKVASQKVKIEIKN
ncbi:MAG: hypothetical protein ACREDS_04880 [Limisphaerales bacterium]